MLCLARKLCREIFIRHAGEKLRIVVTELSGSAVVLSFDGPLSFEIVRDNAKCQGPCDERERRGRP